MQTTKDTRGEKQGRKIRRKQVWRQAWSKHPSTHARDKLCLGGWPTYRLGDMLINPV